MNGNSENPILEKQEITFDDINSTIIQPKCLSCHTGQSPSGEVDLSSYESIVLSRFLVAGNAEASLLFQAVANGSMPPDGKLSQDLIENLKSWINAGALKDGSQINQCRDPVPLLPRLTNYEYSQIMTDLVGNNFDPAPLATLPIFPTLYGFDRLANPSFDRASVESYLNVADSVALQIENSPTLLSICGSNKPFYELNWNNCALPLLSRVGQSLFRRPLRIEELQNLKSLFNGVQEIAINRIRSSTIPIDGFLDGFSNRNSSFYAGGWAYDPAWPERSVEVKIYIKRPGENGMGSYVGSSLAHLPRPDVNNALGISGDRGFLFPIPKNYLDGTEYIVTAYAFGTATDKALIEPKTLKANANSTGPLIGNETDVLFKDALHASLISLLMSPNFLFKMEYYPGGFQENEVGYRQASFISFLTGSSFPDAELSGLAAQGPLSGEQITAQTKRLLSKYYDRFSRSFGAFWIGYKDYMNANPNSLDFSMGEEARLVFKNVLEEKAPLSSLLNPGYTYLNSTLATHYGMSGGTSPTNYLKVTTAERGGVLNQAQFLMKTANTQETNPIKRGIWVLDKVLCRSLPTLDAATFEEIAQSQANVDPNASLVERMALHRKYGNRCATCHSQIDPLGLGLEN
ncbi:MAG: DUF1588 domain-containing protein, partial [Bdellovibrionales bacterium]|nr:DUF1588 domain-containing protein [Bdellovibrionales bacterium]